MNTSIESQVSDVAQSRGISESRAIRLVERDSFDRTPGDPLDFLQLVEAMISTSRWVPLSVATLWLRRRRDLHTVAHLPRYGSWVREFATYWGACDAICNRVINHVVYGDDKAYRSVLEWTRSEYPFVRRAAAVALIEERDNFTVHYDINRVLHAASLLLNDDDRYVQKGVGWLLKAASKVYPEDVVSFLESNVREMPRLVFRYALEKMPAAMRQRMMAL